MKRTPAQGNRAVSIRQSNVTKVIARSPIAAAECS